jgi:hypothetical protein
VFEGFELGLRTVGDRVGAEGRLAAVCSTRSLPSPVGDVELTVDIGMSTGETSVEDSLHRLGLHGWHHELK